MLAVISPFVGGIGRQKLFAKRLAALTTKPEFVPEFLQRAWAWVLGRTTKHLSAGKGFLGRRNGKGNDGEGITAGGHWKLKGCITAPYCVLPFVVKSGGATHKAPKLC